MNLLHGERGRQIDFFFKINFYSVGNLGVCEAQTQRGFAAGKKGCDCRGHSQGGQSPPSCPSPLPLSSKMCPLLIDWRGLEGDFSRPGVQKELVFLSLKKSLASSMKAGQSITRLLN